MPPFLFTGNQDFSETPTKKSVYIAGLQFPQLIFFRRKLHFK
jgi:hypothetical protein